MKNLLAATDFSAQARHAAERAALLARASRAPLHLLHVLPGAALDDMRRWLGPSHPLEQQLREEARQQLAQQAQALQQQRQLVVNMHDRCGPVVEQITRLADELDSSLLVLGARGSGFLRRLVLGTTAERVLRRSPRPLLVVRQTPHEAYRRVLVAVDFSHGAARSLALAHEVAPRAHLVLLHAFQVPFEDKLRFAGVNAETVELYRRQARVAAMQRLHGLAEAAALKPGAWTSLVLVGEASQRIVEQEQAQDCELVVLGKQGQSAAEDLLLGSVTKHVLAEGSADVLACTARNG